MSYYFAKTLHCSFDEAVQRTTDALKNAGFGIITEIDVKETLRKKLGVDFRNYRILGACNPAMAREAIEIEDKIGTMLPCNVIVREEAPGRVVVGFLDPQTMVGLVGKPGVKTVADQAESRLRRVCEALGAGGSSA